MPANPYTVTYGPWAPDLADVGVQAPAYLPAVTLPLADCNGVYWRDGSYRCLPGPASIGPSLGVPITNAVSWYDQATGKEIVFAATANGLNMLEDGTWSVVPIQSSAQATAVGSLIQLTLGAPTYTAASTSISPSSQSQSDTNASHTFAAEVLTVTGATPSAIVWNFFGQSGTGTWSIFSGQGTTNCVAEVTGVPDASSCSISLQYTATIGGVNVSGNAPLSHSNTHLAPYTGTLVAGEFDDGSGDQWIGYDAGNWGSLSPTTDSTGKTINELTYAAVSGSGLTVQLGMSGFVSDPGYAYFSQLVVTGGPTFVPTPASYTWQGAGHAVWQWTVTSSPFANGNSYTVTLDYPP